MELWKKKKKRYFFRWMCRNNVRDRIRKYWAFRNDRFASEVGNFLGEGYGLILDISMYWLYQIRRIPMCRSIGVLLTVGWPLG